MLAQRRRRWANIDPTFGQRLVFTGYSRLLFVYRWVKQDVNPLTAGTAYIRVFIFC